MSAAVPGQVIPSLKRDQISGRGKLDGRFGTRKTNGTEAGDVFGDCSVIHVLTKREELEALDEALPGASGLWGLAYGPATDGFRNIEWKPKETDVDLVLSGVDSGAVLYEGPAEVKRAVLRLSEKAAVLTVYLRLHGSLRGSVEAGNGHLGRAVDYEMTAASLEGSTKTGAVEGGLPFGGGAAAKVGRPVAGDVVTVMGDDEPGRAISVSEAGVILVGPATIGADEPTREWKIDDVIAVTPICGPKGGKPDGKLDDLVREAEEQGVEVTWGDLVDSLLALSELGTVSRHANGWPLVAEVVADVVERAVAREEGDGDLVDRQDEGADDLPEEA